MDNYRRRPPMEGFSRPGSLGAEAYDDDSVEGHMMDDRNDTTELADDTEGHGVGSRKAIDDDDTEGHGVGSRKAVDDDDTEGHGVGSRKAFDDDDTEGHGVGSRKAVDDDDTEGHSVTQKRS